MASHQARNEVAKGRAKNDIVNTVTTEIVKLEQQLSDTVQITVTHETKEQGDDGTEIVMREVVVAEVNPEDVNGAVSAMTQGIRSGHEANKLPDGVEGQTSATVTTITKRLARLRQFQDWIEEDPYFADFVDSIINKRVQSATRRQAIISIIVAILSLIAGWLLNAVSPISFLPH